MQKSATIDKVMQSKLTDVSAAQFLEALQAEGLALVAKDKRVEYWSEPERVPSIDLEQVLEKMRNRKKWFEREKFPGFERQTDLADMVSNPAVVERIADAVVERIQRSGSS